VSFDEFLQQINNPVFLVIAFIVVLVIIRVVNKIRIAAGAKSYITKANKLRRNKFNGPELVEFTATKRRRGSNTYRKLKGKAKSRVDRFFQYKEEELPAIVNFSHGKKGKNSKKKLIIFITNGQKKMLKIRAGKTTKDFINLTNKFECLDQLIQFLHNLPEAIMNRQEYDIYIPEHEVSIGYQIK